MTWEDEFVLYGENILLRRDHKKISDECRDYESVNDNSHAFLHGLCPKIEKK